MRLMGVDGSNRSQIGDCGDASKIRESIENEGYADDMQTGITETNCIDYVPTRSRAAWWYRNDSLIIFMANLQDLSSVRVVKMQIQDMEWKIL